MAFRNKFDKALEYVLIALLSVLVIDVLWQVASRYLLDSPSSFTDELAGYLLIWVGVLGAAYVTGRQEHLAIDLLLQKSNPYRQKWLIIIINMFVALFALSVMVVGGTWLVVTRFRFDVVSAAIQLPLGYVYLVLPLSGVIIAYYSVSIIIDKVKEFKNDSSSQRK